MTQETTKTIREEQENLATGFSQTLKNHEKEIKILKNELKELKKEVWKSVFFFTSVFGIMITIIAAMINTIGFLNKNQFNFKQTALIVTIIASCFLGAAIIFSGFFLFIVWVYKKINR